MSMEKYGTDLSTLPPDNDQIRMLKEAAGKEFVMPKTKLEAQEMMEKLAGDKK